MRPKYFIYFFFFLLHLLPVAANALSASFTTSVTSGCAPITVSFTNTSTGAASYSWDFGNTTTSASTNTSTTYSTPGTYTVTLTAFNGTAQSKAFSTIIVYGPPAVSFSATPTTICPGASVAFTDHSILNAPGAGTYNWNFGTGSTSAGSTLSYTYTAPGIYNVTLTVTSGAGCIASLTKPAYITVSTPPAAGFSGSSPNLCRNYPIETFTNTTTGTPPFTSYWTFGDGTVSTQDNPPPHTYSGTGPYTVKLQVVDATGCLDTITRVNYIHVGTVTPAVISSPAGACAGVPTAFTNASSSSTASVWNFGDNSGISISSTAVHVYNITGTYTVSLANTYNGCIDTVRKNIIVYPLPPVNFTTSPAAPCPAPVIVHFANPGGAVSYRWDFGDGGTSTMANPDHAYTYNDTDLGSDNFIPFNVTYIATNSNGCTDSATVRAVNIYPFYAPVTSSARGGCIPFADTFIVDITHYHYPIATYSWDFGDGGTSTLAKPVHNYNQYHVDTGTLTLTATNGCVIKDTFIIHAGTKDTADFIATPAIACDKDSIKFMNLSHGATNYLWDFGDNTGSADSSARLIHFYTSPGIYTVALTATNNGCDVTLKRKDYIIINPPKPQFDFSFYCDGTNTIKLYNRSLGATSWIWNFGDGTTDAVLDSPVHTYSAPGNYSVLLIAHNDTSGCRDDTEAKLITIAHTVATIASESSICLGRQLSFISGISGMPAFTGFIWSYAGFAVNWYYDGKFLSAPQPSKLDYTYGTPGNKNITLVIRDYKGCYDTVYKTVLIAQPAVNFSAPLLSICAGTPLSFTDSTTDSATGYVSRVWSFGDGTIVGGNLTNPSHTYLNAGIDTVKLVVTDNVGCVDSSVKINYISVHKPIADFSGSAQFICINNGVQFSSLSTGAVLSYSWSFGDGGTSVAANPFHVYSHVGIYAVRLSVTDSPGCRDSVTKLNYVTVEDNPVASFSLTDTLSVCSSLIDTFSNHSTTGAGFTYKWSFGDGNTSTLFNTQNTYTAPGAYTVTLVVTSPHGCADTASDTVNMVGYAGSGVFSYNPLQGCAPLTVNYTAILSTGVSSYVYDFSDGSTLATPATSVTHTYLKPGPYLPALILIGTNGCKSTSPGLDTIKVDGVFSGYTYIPDPACGNDTVQFTDTSHGAYSSSSRVWQFSDGKSDSSMVTEHYYVPGTYTFTLFTTTTTGCSDTLHGHITIYNPPHINAGKDTVLCLGDSALLSPSGGVSYTWEPAYFISCTACTNPFVSPQADTGYIVTGTDTIGCEANDTVHITLKIKSTGSIDSGGSLCQHSSFTLGARADFQNAQFTWFPSAGLNNPNISNPVATPDSTTVYMVVIKEGRCIPDTLYATVTVFPLPVISLGPDQTIFAGTSIELTTSETGVSTYWWTPADGLSCDSCAAPIASPDDNIIYVVTGYSDHGCTDTANIKITVVCDHSQVYLPNTFTPNGDGANDRFYPRGKGLKTIKSFRIYDRWGELVFSRQNINTNEMNNGWDGTYKGQKLNSDIYVYFIDAICNTGEAITWSGDIALLR